MANDPATLIVGPSWVGDMVMAQALFRQLKADDPDRPLDVLAPAWSLPIVARMPEIRDGIASETGHGEIGIGKRRRIAAALRGRYDGAIVLPRSFKAALIPWFAGIPTRTGFRGESRYVLINDVRPFDPTILDQTVKRFLALGNKVTDPFRSDLKGSVTLFPRLRVSDDNQRRVVRALGIETDRPVVAMMPGAEYGPAKCWPLEYFAVLAGQLDAAGFRVWVLGSTKDNDAGETIAADGTAINLCGETSLEDVIDVLALCQQAVSNDSGLMHIAAAVGCHVHGIYGSSSPAFTPPLTASADIHHLDLDCSPCFERTCPLRHLNCLREIAPESVFARISAKSG